LENLSKTRNTEVEIFEKLNQFFMKDSIPDRFPTQKPNFLNFFYRFLKTFFNFHKNGFALDLEEVERKREGS